MPEDPPDGVALLLILLEETPEEVEVGVASDVDTVLEGAIDDTIERLDDSDRIEE